MSADIQLSVEFGVSILQKIVDAGYSFLKSEHQKRDVFGKATERYVKGLIDRYGEVRVLGMNKPVPLLSLYVRANILEKIRSRIGNKIHDLEEFFDFDRRAFGKTVESKDGEDVANQLQRFIVLGKPGAGKTTFLKYLALAMVHKQSLIQHRRLPIFVTLRDWADRKCSLMDYINHQFSICNFDTADLFVDNMLRQGNCLILLDGLDEVSQEANLDGIIRDIRDFTDKYSGNQFVISCRIAAYNHWFEHFTDVEMADFNEEQIERFARNWFSGEPKTAGECIQGLRATPQLKELASVPLLLTLLCIAYDENNHFSGNRSELYKDAIDALLRKWDSSRRIRRDDPYKQLSLMQKENMFARIAFGTFSENRYFIREQDLIKMIGLFISNLPAFKAENLEVDSREVLRSIESHHGIFVERAKSIYSFAHLTFQEFFTAKYIVDNDSSQNLELQNLVQQHLYDDKWKEVFLLVTGMLHNADELLLLMLRSNKGLLAEPELNKLMRTSNMALLPGDYQFPEEVRIANVLSRGINQARDLTLSRILDLNLDLDRADRIDHAQIRGLTTVRGLESDLDRAHASALELAIEFDSHRSNIRARTLGINIDIIGNLAIQLTPNLYFDNCHNFIPKLSNFLQGSLLILQCLKVAYVSTSTREYILSQLFAPLEEPE